MALFSSDEKPVFDEFELPEQTLHKLTFCNHKPRHLQALLETLPSTQSKHVSAVLYKLLPELNQLIIGGSQRLELLSLLRPYVHHCIDGLAEQYLKQPLSLEENTTKIAAIGQALQRHLCDGYIITIKQLLQTNKKGKDLELATALYYATHGLGQLLYRSHQLYAPRPPHTWKKLNYLYHLVQVCGLEKQAIMDNLLQTRASLTLEQAYFRMVIFSCSNTNQLRQVDIMHLYHALEHWSGLITLSPLAQNRDQTQTDAIYMVNFDSDDGPIYLARTEESTRVNLYAVNLDHLIDTLHKQDTQALEDSQIPVHNRQTLLTHLMICWQQRRERQTERIATDSILEICVGLKAVHQQLLCGTSFEDFIQDTQPASHFSLDGFPRSERRTKPAPVEPETTIEVIAADESLEGYCLRWTEKVPPQIKAGEILLLRRKGDQFWQAGTIRWAQRLNANTYVGVQLLSSRVEAAAASTTLDSGEVTPFFRSVLLKSEDSDQSACLLTPAIPFNSRQKIQLQLKDGCKQAQLTQLLSRSGSVSLFNYRRL